MVDRIRLQYLVGSGWYLALLVGVFGTFLAVTDWGWVLEIDGNRLERFGSWILMLFKAKVSKVKVQLSSSPKICLCF